MKLFKKIKKYNIFTYEGRYNIATRRYNKFTESLNNFKNAVKELNENVDRLFKNTESLETNKNDSEIQNSIDNSGKKIDSDTQVKTIIDAIINSDDVKINYSSLYKTLPDDFEKKFNAITACASMRDIADKLKDVKTVNEKFVIENNSISSTNSTCCYTVTTENSSDFTKDTTVFPDLSAMDVQLKFGIHKSQKEILKMFANDMGMKFVKYANFGVPGQGALVYSKDDDLIGINIELKGKVLKIMLYLKRDIEENYNPDK